MSDTYSRPASMRNRATCPVGNCPHGVLLHDVDEIPWPRIERCTVPDCDCSGLDVEAFRG